MLSLGACPLDLLECVQTLKDRGLDIPDLVLGGVDLIEDNRCQLLSAGIRPDRIYDSGLCTACENERFYSYRKEGQGVGRLMGVIAIKSGVIAVKS